MKKALIALMFLAAFAGVELGHAAATVPEIEEFDLRTYFPDNYGLKDVVFEIRSTEMMEALSKDEGLGKLIDVYYKVHWVRPGKFLVTVEGLPKGHVNLIEQLKQSVRPVLELVFPEKLGGKVRSYKLARTETGSEVVVKGEDESGSRPVTHLELVFDAKNRLKEAKSQSLMGPSSAVYDYTVKSWGNNKWVLDKMSTRVGPAGKETLTTYALSYTTINGIGLPDAISVDTKLVVGKDESKLGRAKYVFSKYEVNTGKALRAIQGP